MAFRSPKQRAFYFAKKSGKPPMGPAQSQNAMAKPDMAPPNTMGAPQFSIPGLPKSNKFGRIKRNFRM
jgi:hypothetical protein